MRVEVLIVRAFTINPDGGNPAGVILDANELKEDQMQFIAAMLGFSESAFVLVSTVAGFRVRFFTPTQEVPLCGHGTIAAFYALLNRGRITFGESDTVVSSQETSAGVLSVTSHRDGLITMEQAKPVFYSAKFDALEIASLLGLTVPDLDTQKLPIQLVSTGSPKLVIPVRTLATLEKIMPDLEGMKKLCANSEVRGFYPFTQETKEADSDFHARQFNPYAGINEDLVTGVAAGALGAYSVQHGISDKKEFVVEQGYFMSKGGGKMFVAVLGDRVTVGGYAVITGTQILTM